MINFVNKKFLIILFVFFSQSLVAGKSRGKYCEELNILLQGNKSDFDKDVEIIRFIFEMFQNGGSDSKKAYALDLLEYFGLTLKYHPKFNPDGLEEVLKAIPGLSSGMKSDNLRKHFLKKIDSKSVEDKCVYLKDPQNFDKKFFKFPDPLYSSFLGVYEINGVIKIDYFVKKFFLNQALSKLSDPKYSEIKDLFDTKITEEKYKDKDFDDECFFEILEKLIEKIEDTNKIKFLIKGFRCVEKINSASLFLYYLKNLKNINKFEFVYEKFDISLLSKINIEELIKNSDNLSLFIEKKQPKNKELMAIFEEMALNKDDEFKKNILVLLYKLKINEIKELKFLNKDNFRNIVISFKETIIEEVANDCSVINFLKEKFEDDFPGEFNQTEAEMLIKFFNSEIADGVIDGFIGKELSENSNFENFFSEKKLVRFSDKNDIFISQLKMLLNEVFKNEGKRGNFYNSFLYFSLKTKDIEIAAEEIQDEEQKEIRQNIIKMYERCLVTIKTFDKNFFDSINDVDLKANYIKLFSEAKDAEEEVLIETQSLSASSNGDIDEDSDIDESSTEDLEPLNKSDKPKEVAHTNTPINPDLNSLSRIIASTPEPTPKIPPLDPKVQKSDSVVLIPSTANKEIDQNIDQKPDEPIASIGEISSDHSNAMPVCVTGCKDEDKEPSITEMENKRQNDLDDDGYPCETQKPTILSVIELNLTGTPKPKPKPKPLSAGEEVSTNSRPNVLTGSSSEKLTAIKPNLVLVKQDSKESFNENSNEEKKLSLLNFVSLAVGLNSDFNLYNQKFSYLILVGTEGGSFMIGPKFKFGDLKIELLGGAKLSSSFNVVPKVLINLSHKNFPVCLAFGVFGKNKATNKEIFGVSIGVIYRHDFNKIRVVGEFNGKIM